MPIYVFECPECKKRKEFFCSWEILEEKKNAGELVCWTNHPHIYVMKRIIAQTNFQLKGEGWAKDGYSKNENKST